MSDEFFQKRNCERCGGSLHIRTMSWFTNQTICGDCSQKETELKRDMRAAGQDPDQLEGCGYLPKIENTDAETRGRAGESR